MCFSGLEQVMVHAGSWHLGTLWQLLDNQDSCQSHTLPCPFRGKMREKLGSENPSTPGSYLQEALRWLEQALPLLGAHSRHTLSFLSQIWPKGLLRCK